MPKLGNIIIKFFKNFATCLAICLEREFLNQLKELLLSYLTLNPIAIDILIYPLRKVVALVKDISEATSHASSTIPTDGT